VGEVLERHEATVVFEDDLVCVPGTYEYMASALRAYRDHPEVMSVTGWTHPSVTPADVGSSPYFDGRAECWTWGTWARVWQGMDRDAAALAGECERCGIDIHGYGHDLAPMARSEHTGNIWAVRFLYWHIRNGGLCVRPPWSLIEHIGFDARATHETDEARWGNPLLGICPPIPGNWPDPKEHPACRALWKAAYPPPPPRASWPRRTWAKLRRSCAKRLGRQH
jgi:hypothetical protein